MRVKLTPVTYSRYGSSLNRVFNQEKPRLSHKKKHLWKYESIPRLNISPYT